VISKMPEPNLLSMNFPNGSFNLAPVYWMFDERFAALHSA